MGKKVHKSYRLDADLLEAVDAWAASSGIRPGEAVADLLRIGLDGPAATISEDGETLAALKGNVEDLRGEVKTLKEQLEKKDEQIAGLMNLAGNAQTLQAAEAQRALGSGVDALEVEEEDAPGVTEATGADETAATVEDEPGEGSEGEDGAGTPRTWRERLAAWLLG